MAGGVIDGQAVSAAITDPAFIFKNADDMTTFNVELASPIGSDGSTIQRPQREFNALWHWLGGLVNQAITYLPAWTSNNFGTSTDTIIGRIEAIDAGVGFKAGSVSIANGVSTFTVTLTAALPNTNYAVLSSITNLFDSNPQFLQAVITAKTTTTFTVLLNAQTDSASYGFDYRISSYA